jgi:hypothetical protein
MSPAPTEPELDHRSRHTVGTFVLAVFESGEPLTRCYRITQTPDVATVAGRSTVVTDVALVRRAMLEWLGRLLDTAGPS